MCIRDSDIYGLTIQRAPDADAGHAHDGGDEHSHHCHGGDCHAHHAHGESEAHDHGGAADHAHGDAGHAHHAHGEAHEHDHGAPESHGHDHGGEEQCEQPIELGAGRRVVVGNATLTEPGAYTLAVETLSLIHISEPTRPY